MLTVLFRTLSSKNASSLTWILFVNCMSLEWLFWKTSERIKHLAGILEGPNHSHANTKELLVFFILILTRVYSRLCQRLHGFGIAADPMQKQM